MKLPKTTRSVGRRDSSVGEPERTAGPPPHPAKKIWNVAGSLTGPVLSADESFYEHRPTSCNAITDLLVRPSASSYLRRIAKGETL